MGITREWKNNAVRLVSTVNYRHNFLHNVYTNTSGRLTSEI